MNYRRTSSYACCVSVNKTKRNDEKRINKRNVRSHGFIQELVASGFTEN